MKVFVGLISSNKKLCEEYQRRRTGIIPQSSLPKRLKEGVVFSVGAFNPNADDRVTTVEFLAYATRNADAVMLLMDSSLTHTMTEVSNSFFTVIFDVPGDLENCQNFLGQKVSRPLRNFSFLIEEMNTSDTEQVAILPLRNFAGDDLQELARICREDTSLATFQANAIGQIALIKHRKRPRRKSSYPTVYIVDDREKHFHYGKERHAKLGTGAPHVIACEINGNFRFGKRIDCDRHYNVSCGSGDETSISGAFSNCHDCTVEVKATTHLNMFSNDFF